TQTGPRQPFPGSLGTGWDARPGVLFLPCHARTGGRRQPERRRVGIDDGRAFLALAHMAAEREGLAEGEPALAGEAAHFPMVVRRSEQSQPSGQAVAARNILRPQNQGLLYKRTPSAKTIRAKRVLWWGIQINSERTTQKNKDRSCTQHFHSLSTIF